MSRVARRPYLTGSMALLGGILSAACDRSEVRRRPETGAGGGTPTPPVVPPPAKGDRARRAWRYVPGRPISPVPAKGASTLPVLVKLEWMSEHKAVLRDLAIRFTDQHPHLRISWQQRLWPTSRHSDTALRMAAAGRLEGVLGEETAIIAVLVAAQAVLGLNCLIARDRYPIADYWPGAVQALQWQGDLFGLPTTVVPTVLYYHPAVVAAAGVTVPTPPWTWAQFLAVAQQLTAPPVFGFAFSEQRAADILPWLWSYGGRLVDADFRVSVLTRPEALAALQWLLDLTFAHRVSPQAADLQRAGVERAWELLKLGQLGMYYTSWYGRRRYAVAEPPAGRQQAATSLDWAAYETPAVFSLIRDSDSGDPDGAWSFLRWWTSRDVQQEFHARSSVTAYANVGVPARQSLVREQPARYAAGTVAALASARAAPLHPTWRELVRVFDAGLAPLWEGKQDVAAAMAAVSQQQNAILDRWWRKQRGSP